MIHRDFIKKHRPYVMSILINHLSSIDTHIMGSVFYNYTVFAQNTFIPDIILQAACAAVSVSKIPNTAEPLPVICAPRAPPLSITDLISASSGKLSATACSNTLHRQAPTAALSPQRSAWHIAVVSGRLVIVTASSFAKSSGVENAAFGL